MSKTTERSWKVWIDKDGHITSHRPYLPTSPVEWVTVTEAKKRGTFNTGGSLGHKATPNRNIFIK